MELSRKQVREIDSRAQAALERVTAVVQDVTVMAVHIDKLKSENEQLKQEAAHTISLAQDIEAKWPRIKQSLERLASSDDVPYYLRLEIRELKQLLN